MSETNHNSGRGSKAITDAERGQGRAPQGPNLAIAYGLMALALLIAIAFAALIVWPFYKAR